MYVNHQTLCTINFVCSYIVNLLKTCLYTHATTGDVVLQIGEMTAQKTITIRSQAIRIKYPITIQCLDKVKVFNIVHVCDDPMDTVSPLADKNTIP